MQAAAVSAYMADPHNPKYQTCSPHPLPLRCQRDWSKTPPEDKAGPVDAQEVTQAPRGAADSPPSLSPASRVPDSSVTVTGARKRGFLARAALPSADVKFW